MPQDRVVLQLRGNFRFKILTVENDLVSLNSDNHGPSEMEWLSPLTEQKQS